MSVYFEGTNFLKVTWYPNQEEANTTATIEIPLSNQRKYNI